MKDPILVVMAAGMGSRYGGLKQIDPVGLHGEIIIDYSLYDAYLAGFRRVVFIIKKDNAGIFREVIGSHIDSLMEAHYVYQTLDDLPDGYAVPAGREKPWGTGHAVLAAILWTPPLPSLMPTIFTGATPLSKSSPFSPKHGTTAFTATPWSATRWKTPLPSPAP